MISALSPRLSPYLNFEFTKARKTSCSSILSLSPDQLTKKLTAEDCNLDLWLEWKDEIKIALSKASSDAKKLDEILSTLTNWGMKKNPTKLMEIFQEIISLDHLTTVVTAQSSKEELKFKNIEDLVVQNAVECPVLQDNSLKGQMNAEWKRFRPLAIYFVPNLLNIFLGAFNFLDSNKKFTTLWEKYLLLDIVYKFFQIPKTLIKLLEPVCGVALKVYLVASLIFLASAIVIGCYQRFLKPLPDEIVNCENLDKKMDRGLIDPKVGQTNEINHLIAALAGHDHVILTGLSGEGKTTLIHNFIQLKHEGKLPKEKLQDLTVFEADCGAIMSGPSFNHADLINQIKDQIAGYENKILLFFDEFNQIAINKPAFLAFKKRFLQDKPACKSILAVTHKEWQDIVKMDTDLSFTRRVHQIAIGPSSDDQVKKVLKNFQIHFAEDVFVNEGAIDAIVKLSAQKDYLPDVGKPAKAENIFKTAIGKCRTALNHHYGAVNLKEKEKQKSQKIIQKVKAILLHRKAMNFKFYSLNNLFNKAIAKSHSTASVVNRLEINLHDDLDLVDGGEDENKEVVQPTLLKEKMSEKDQTLYLWYHFYGKKSIEKLLKEEIAKIGPEITIEVNKKLVDTVYDDLKNIG